MSGANAAGGVPPDPPPGPPRGRRRRPNLEGAVRRVEAMRRAEQSGGVGGLPATMLRLLADVVLLLKDIAADPRVPRREKVLAGIAVAYLVSPLDLVPDWVPGLGQADDVVIAVTAFRRLVHAAGYDVVYDLWRGSDEGLALVLGLAGVTD